MFKDLVFKTKSYGLGEQAKVMFDNGYGASIVSGFGSFSSEGLPYELAVIDKDGICYDTPICDDVIGHQSADDIDGLLTAIEALPPLEKV